MNKCKEIEQLEIIKKQMLSGAKKLIEIISPVFEQIKNSLEKISANFNKLYYEQIELIQAAINDYYLKIGTYPNCIFMTEKYYEKLKAIINITGNKIIKRSYSPEKEEMILGLKIYVIEYIHKNKNSDSFFVTIMYYDKAEIIWSEEN